MRRNLNKIACSISAFVIALVMVVVCVSNEDIKASAASGFKVNGTTIIDANGNPFVMRGVNVAHAWYADKTETSIRAIAGTGANTVRVVLSDGGQYSKTSYSEVKNIIEMCKSNKLVCVLEVHDATGSNNTYDLDRAVNYWIEMKNLLSDYSDYVIVNIANEWYGDWNGDAWANGYKSAIPKLRNAGISNLLMVDCAGWGQYPDSIKNNGREVLDADTHKNTMFSIHMYEYAGKDSGTVRSNIDNAMNLGVPLVIGEFGQEHSNGNVDEDTIMSYCQQKGAGYLGWSWKGNGYDIDGKSLAYLDIAKEWDGSSLSSWGDRLINGSNGIRTTSQICSVYTGYTPPESSSSTPDSSSSQGEGGNTGSSKQLFSGSAYASSWGQAVTVGTSRQGGDFNASDIKSGGYFYVEYQGDWNELEFVLESKSGGASWAKVRIGESGTANGNNYVKFFYDDCVSAYGSSNFGSSLDYVHVGAVESSVTVKKLTYYYGGSSGGDDSSSQGGNDSSSSSQGDNSSSQGEGGNTGSSKQLFSGSAYASSWGQAVTVGTSRQGGDFNASDIKSGGYFYVEYQGDWNELEFVLESKSGGASWAKVRIGESGTANGNNYVKFFYDDCVSAYGSSNFGSSLDYVHVGAVESSVTIKKLTYYYGGSSGGDDSSSQGGDDSSSQGGDDSSSTGDNDNYTSIFWGSNTASPWGQAVSAMTSKNGGSFNAGDINKGGYFYVEYSGTEKQVEFILQSWSGAEGWAKVQPSETGSKNGHYYAKYSYENCVSALGTSDFANKLDQIHAGAANSSATIYSVCYCY